MSEFLANLDNQLTDAIREGNAKSVQQLLRSGAIVQDWGVALDCALRRGKSASFRVLLTTGIGCTDRDAWYLWKEKARNIASPAICGVFETFSWNEYSGVVEEIIV